jgi:hypothetical protein
MWLHELGEKPFNRDERKFLSSAGRSYVAIDILIDRVLAILGPETPVRGRQTFLARMLLDERLFASFDDAYAFADSYFLLAKQGPISKYLLWDWE